MKIRLATVVFLLIVSAFASRFLISSVRNSDHPIAVCVGFAVVFELPTAFAYLCWDELLSWLARFNKPKLPEEVNSEQIAELDNTELLAQREIGPPPA